MNCFLKIDEILNEDLINKYGDHHISELLLKKENLLVCDCSYSEYEIPLSTKFSFLYTESNIYEISCELIYISVWSKSIDIVPFGYKTVCVFKFLRNQDLELFRGLSKKIGGNYLYISTMKPLI